MSTKRTLRTALALTVFIGWGLASGCRDNNVAVPTLDLYGPDPDDTQQPADLQPSDLQIPDTPQADNQADDTTASTDTPGKPDSTTVDTAADQLNPTDNSEPPLCTPGAKACIAGKQAVCDGQFGWLLEACPAGTVCDGGECIASACEPLSFRCVDGGVQLCSPGGDRWSEVMPCPEGQVCQAGVCVPPTCEPGARDCLENTVLECGADGQTWTSATCPEGQVCFGGTCIECVRDSDCTAGLACIDGTCLPAPLSILTPALPDGQTGQPYQATLQADGGTPPYSWQLSDGTLPAGLVLNQDGTLEGTPTEPETFTITVSVSDEDGATVDHTYVFTIHGGTAAQIVILTGSPLPNGEEGTPYETSFEANGGLPPYVWGVVGGALPDGLSLSSTGTLTGIPTAHGDFGFDVKAFDNGNPVGWGSKSFALTITIAPLEIIGDQQYDLFVAKIIILPLITVVEGIPIPYSTELQAKGGVKPYHWTEQDLPSFISYLIPNGGIPEGLTLEDDGTLHGGVTDPSLAASVTIPFTQISLTGFFFVGQVTDSQEPAESKSALYLIPTVPVEF